MGTTIAFSARGIASGQWWRKVIVISTKRKCGCCARLITAGTYERVTQEGGAKEMWPMWSADGRRLYYVSDRTDAGNKNGAQNIWVAALNTSGGRSDFRRLSNFTDGRVLWPSISYDGRAIVFEHNFEHLEVGHGERQATEVSITRRGASSGPAIERLPARRSDRELQLSPDGKKVAFVVRGEVFAASAR